MKQAICFLLIFLCSCAQNVEKPDNLLSEQKMTDIMVDIYIHQQSSYLNTIGGNPPDYAKANTHLLQEHGVNVRNFEKSFEYYFLHPDLYESLLIKIGNRLENQLPEEERIKREDLRQEGNVAKEQAY